MLILALLLAAFILFTIDTVMSRSMVSAGLACGALAFVLSNAHFS